MGGLEASSVIEGDTRNKVTCYPNCILEAGAASPGPYQPTPSTFSTRNIYQSRQKIKGQQPEMSN